MARCHRVLNNVVSVLCLKLVQQESAKVTGKNERMMEGLMTQFAAAQKERYVQLRRGQHTQINDGGPDDTVRCGTERALCSTPPRTTDSN